MIYDRTDVNWRKPVFARRPLKNDEYLVTAEQVDTFQHDGYVILPQITTEEDLSEIRVIYDRLFARRNGWNEGDFFDYVGTDEIGKEAALPQMLYLSKYAPKLRRTRFWANAQVASRQILGSDARYIFDHGIRKPPRVGAATSWHQDRAYSPRNSPPSMVTVWLALEDVSIDMRCMHYIPGSHRGPLYEHRSVGGDDRIHGLEALGIDTSRALAHPVAAGTAILHHSGTLHYAGPNTSDRVRRAYAVAFCTGTAEDQSVQKEHSWNEGRQTARLERQLAFLEAREKTISHLLKRHIKHLLQVLGVRV